MTAPPQDRPAKNAPWYVKAFVAFHVVAITAWALPNPDEELVKGTAKPVGSDYLLLANKKYFKDMQALNAYMYVSGWWQYWDMFSPNPARIDIWVHADITYRDKTTRRYQYPRMYLLPIPSKYPNERFRKFYERVNDKQYEFLWPQFALRIAYLNDNPANPPVRVKLTRHYLEVMPPGKPQPSEYTPSLFFDYVVDQNKLAKMRQGL